MTPVFLSAVPDLTNEDYAAIAVGDRYAIVDLSSIDLISGISWNLLQGHNGKLYAYHRPFYMHRIIAQTPPGSETDHINGDGLDNRKANLRTASASQNRANMGKPKLQRVSTSQYKGVFWERSRGKWRASIGIMGRSLFLGRYTNETEAAKAYDTAALNQWGEFAQVNFPEGVA